MKTEFLLLVGTFIIFYTFSAEGCPTYISIWPSGKTSYEATIQVKWDDICDPKPNWIKLYDSDPSVSEPFPRFVFNTQNESLTQIVVDNRIGKLSLPGGWDRRDQFSSNATKPKSFPRGRCLDYYVASFHDDELLSVNCLKVQPNWMRLNQHIMDIPIKNIFIPGTHSSGSYYNISKKGSIKLEKYFHKQNFDVWTQLVFGVRYLDLSIGYQTKHEGAINSFWTIEGDIYVNHLTKVLDDVKTFVNLSGEVIFIDFNAFQLGFENNVAIHQKLVNMLEKELGNMTFRYSSTSKYKESYQFNLNDIVKIGKNIILMYPLHKLAEYNIETDLFWPTWKKVNTENMNDTQILDYMRLLLSGKTNTIVSNEGFILHLARSHNILSHIDGKITTTRERAISINSKIKNWLSGPWSLYANVITSDFIMSTNLIELAISTNRFKAYQIANNFVSFSIS